MSDGAVRTDQQFNGFRQVWFTNARQRFDGPYTVYWESGPSLCMHGHYAEGAQSGLWTYWSRTGEVELQLTFDHDEIAETRNVPPWTWDETIPAWSPGADDW